MLACLLHTDIFTLIGTKQSYMLVHYFKLFVGGGGRQCFARFKIMLYFRKYPRSAAGGSADHNQIATCVIVHTFTAFAAVNIAVSYHGYAECLLYLSDYLKVSLTAVHLIFCPAVNGNGRRSAFLSNTGNLYGVHVLFVPALSYLHRYGNIGGFYNSFNDMSEKNGIFHKGGACAVACYLRYGTAAVYIYEVGLVL